MVSCGNERADNSARLASRYSAYHAAGYSHRWWRRLFFLDHLYYFGNLAGRQQLSIHDLAYHLYGFHRGCRRRWRRRWRRGDQERHQLLRRQRVKKPERKKDQNANNQALENK